MAAGNIGDPYATKYKGIWVALTVLQRALAGNYVNFGVFELYGDRALADALDVAVRMSLSIPLADIMAFRKVSRALALWPEGSPALDACSPDPVTRAVPRESHHGAST
jgi:hypothetical protein